MVCCNAKQLLAKVISKAAILFIVVAFAFCLAGCTSDAGNTQRAAANDTEATSADSDDTGDGAAVDTENVDYGGSPFLGTWKLLEGTFSDGSPMDAERVEELRQRSLESCVAFYDDGSAVQVFYGANFYGSWMPMDERIGTAEGETAGVVFGGKVYFMNFDASTLVLATEEGERLLYEKTDDREIMSQDEYYAALDAFVGTYRIVSASRDGETITVEAGQMSPDNSLELQSTLRANWNIGEESTELPWGITDADSGYLQDPATGAILTLSDGVLYIDAVDGSNSFTCEKE